MVFTDHPKPSRRNHCREFLPDVREAKCGSGLAREGGGPVDTGVTDRPLSQASQLPHLNGGSLGVYAPP